MGAKSLYSPVVRPGEKLIGGYPEVCSRGLAQEGRDIRRAENKDSRECARIRNFPGYETLTKMKFIK